MSIPPLTPPESGTPIPPPSPPQYFEEPIPTYLAPSVFITILCCLPIGITAIYFASRVASLQAVGNRVAAMQASDKARMWCWIGAIIGLIWPIILLSMIFAGGIGLIHTIQSLVN
jgi:hypothetical protein